jgi:hypothetical protein
MTLEKFKAKSQAFIFNWYRTSENAKKLQKQFSDLGIETYVINSHEEENNNGLPNWINIGESGYMVQQYAKAKEIFSKTYFIEMFADIYDVQAELIIERASYVFSKYDCGVYAPNVDYIYWDFDTNKLPKLEENLYEVKNPESLFSIIHKDILTDVALNPVKYKIGWGIDFLVCALASLQKKRVIRDYITTVRHPRDRGYQNPEAAKEYNEYLNDLGKELKTLVLQKVKGAQSDLRRNNNIVVKLDFSAR